MQIVSVSGILWRSHVPPWFVRAVKSSEEQWTKGWDVQIILKTCLYQPEWSCFQYCFDISGSWFHSIICGKFRFRFLCVWLPVCAGQASEATSSERLQYPSCSCSCSWIQTERTHKLHLCGSFVDHHCDDDPQKLSSDFSVCRTANRDLLHPSHISFCVWDLNSFTSRPTLVLWLGQSRLLQYSSIAIIF